MFYLIAMVFNIFVFASPAYAHIGRAYLDDKPVKLISRFHEKDSSFPESLASDKDIYLIIYATATSSDFYVLARPSVDPGQLARVLDSAVSGTDLSREPVMYMQSKGFTWADAYVDKSKLWQRKSEMRQPVGPVISRLSKAGYRPHTLLCRLLMDKMSHRINVTGYANKKWSVCKINPNRTDIDFTLSAQITSLDALKAILVTFIYPCICVLAIPVLALIARSKRNTPEGRRSLFSTSYLFSVLGCTALISPIQFNVLFSPSGQRLRDLWFGPDGFGLLIIMPLLALPVFALAGGVLGRLIFRGSTPDLPHIKSNKLKSFCSFICLFILISSIDRWSGFFPHDSLLARSNFFMVIILWFFLGFIFGRIKRSWTRLNGTKTANAELLDSLSETARHFGINLRQVDVVDSSPSRKNQIYAKYLRNGTLLIKDDLAEKSTPDEMKFAAAHEFAHFSRHHHLKRLSVLYSGILVTIVCTGLFIATPLNLSIFNWKIWSALAGIALLAYEAIWLSKAQEEEADRLALDYTRDPKAAVGAVMKTSGIREEKTDSIDIDPSDVAFNYLTPFRLRWLRKAADQMNLDVDSAFGRMDQDEALTNRAQEIAASMGVKLSNVEIANPADGKKLVNAGATLGGKIFVGRAIIDTFTPGEIDFVLAHELAHIKCRHVLKMIIGIILGVILMGTGTLAVYSIANPLFSYALWFIVSGALLTIAHTGWVNRRRELAADRIALRTTRNLPSAISALQKLSAGNPMIVPEELEEYMTHPKEVYRLQSLRAEAKKMGIAEFGEEGMYRE